MTVPPGIGGGGGVSRSDVFQMSPHQIAIGTRSSPLRRQLGRPVSLAGQLLAAAWPPSSASSAAHTAIVRRAICMSFPRVRRCAKPRRRGGFCARFCSLFVHGGPGAPSEGPQPHRPEARVLEMTPTEVREIAEATGREVVRETLLAIGLDAGNPLKLQRDFAVMREAGALAMDPDFRKDLEHTRKW